MSRSLKKGPYVDLNILRKITKVKADSGTVIKTWSRASEIAPEMVGYTFGVHNGKTFTEVKITEEMVGHRLGEFSPTRKFVKHGGKMQRELEAGAAAPGAAPAGISAGNSGGQASAAPSPARVSKENSGGQAGEKK